jgi:hypothetical protein
MKNFLYLLFMEMDILAQIHTPYKNLENINIVIPTEFSITHSMCIQRYIFNYFMYIINQIKLIS